MTGPVARPVALQLCPLATPLEQGLERLCTVVRWFELDAAGQHAWLAGQADSVRAVVTGGHLGCDPALMAALPGLGIIAVNGVGVDKVDLALAKRRGIRVTTTPGTLTEDTADLAVGLVISLLREIPAADRHVRDGRWPTGERPLSRKVSGRRFGIVGLGRIGSAVAERLAAFGPIAYTGPTPKPVNYEFHPSALELAGAVDVLIVTCPANATTRHLIDAAVLEALGPDGYLVNVARGSIVDEQALAIALEAWRLAGAALDVFEDEPNVPAALRHSQRTVLTPHVASATVETRGSMAALVLDNVATYFAGGEPPTAVV